MKHQQQSSRLEKMAIFFGSSSFLRLNYYDKQARAKSYNSLRLKCFTLIELLIVIAIIAILAGLIFPAFNNARDMARTISCASNQRQIGTGMHMYVDDSRGFFPLRSYYDESNINRYWTMTMIKWKYAFPSNFLCPVGITRTTSNIGWIQTILNLWKASADKDETFTRTDGYPFAYGYYGINAWITPNEVDSRFSCFIAHYKNPSSKILFTDTRDLANMNVGRYVGSSLCRFSETEGGAGIISPIHNRNKSVNITWMDGHVTTLSFLNPMRPYAYLTPNYFNLN